MARNILRGIRNLIGKMRGRPKVAKVRPTIPVGHRGQALGSTKKPNLSAENISKWKQEATERGEDFIFSGDPFYVHSTMITLLQYFIEENKMLVEFKDGTRKMVSPISVQEAIDFFKAPSKGAEFWSVVLVRGKGNKGKTKKNVVDV